MLNAEHGTNLTSANITDFYNNGTAANIIVDASGLTAAQFNSFQPGRYSTYGGQFLLGFGMAGHIANEPGVNAGAVFSNSNIGGNLSVHFAFHVTTDMQTIPSERLFTSSQTCWATTQGSHAKEADDEISA